MVEIVAGKQRAPVAAGVYNVYTGELADTATPTAARMGLEPPVLCAVRSPDGRPGPARRLVGALFSPRAGGLGRLGDTAVTEPPGFGGPSEPSGAPRTSRTRAVLFVMLGLSATGVLVGGLWAWIAPPIHAVVAITRAGERVHEYLGSESQNFFIAPFMLLGLLSVLAVVASALMWQWREHRGPQMVAGLSIGLTTAAAIAAGVGALVVRLRYGALDFDTVPLSRGDHALTYVTQAPPVFSPAGRCRSPSLSCGRLASRRWYMPCLRPGRRGTTWAAIRLSIRRRTLVLKPWKPSGPGVLGESQPPAGIRSGPCLRSGVSAWIQAADRRTGLSLA